MAINSSDDAADTANCAGAGVESNLQSSSNTREDVVSPQSEPEMINFTII